MALKVKRKKKEEPKKKSSGRQKKIKNIELLETELQMYEQMPEQILVIKGWTQEELDEQVHDLRMKIALSKQGKSSRIKGSTYENKVAKKFLEKWNIRLVRTPMSGGFQKSSDNESFRGDLSCLDTDKTFLLHPECKNQKTWKLKEWHKQAEEDCPPNKIPIVIYHQSQKNVDGKRVEVAEDFVQIRLEDFLNIVDTKKVIIKKKGLKRDELSKSRRNS